MLEKKIDEILSRIHCPYPDPSGPPEEEKIAKESLLEILSLLKELKPEFKDPQGGLSYFEFLEKLQRIYFELAAHRYMKACDELGEFFAAYPINQRRIYNGLVMLLEKVDKGLI